MSQGAYYPYTHRGISLLIFPLFSLILSACAQPVELTVTLEGSGSGSVISSPPGIDCGEGCMASFEQGTQVTLRAQTTPEYAFFVWNGDCAGSASSITLTLTESQNCTASFQPVVHPNQGPAISRVKATPSRGTIPLRVQFSLQASDPDGSIQSVEWDFDGDGKTDRIGLEHSASFTYSQAGRFPATVMVTDDAGASVSKTVRVTAREVSRKPIPSKKTILQLTLKGEGKGMVISTPEGINCGKTCQAPFTRNTEVTLLATTTEESVFEKWTGACQGTDPCRIKMDTNQAVTALFSPLAPARDTEVPVIHPGQLAIDIRLDDPEGLTLDRNGNFFFTDWRNDRILRVDISAGTITTMAGTGVLGYSGDGEQARDAQLFIPTGVVLDHAGNLYIADTYNHRIRRVEVTTGIITTVAGGGFSTQEKGPARDVQLKFPTSVALDSKGNILITDSGNHRIMRVNPVSDTIATVAGNGKSGYSGDGAAATQARLNSPKGIVLDSKGNILITDSGNHRIRRVDHRTGIITTIVGSSTSTLKGINPNHVQLRFPAGVALDSKGNILITDSGNHRILRVNPVSGTITTVAGKGSPGYSGDGRAAREARLNTPKGIVLDSKGNILFADSGNDRIRRVDRQSGIITTVAGGGPG